MQRAAPSFPQKADSRGGETKRKPRAPKQGQRGLPLAACSHTRENLACSPQSYLLAPPGLLILPGRHCAARPNPQTTQGVVVAMPPGAATGSGHKPQTLKRTLETSKRSNLLARWLAPAKTGITCTMRGPRCPSHLEGEINVRGPVNSAWHPGEPRKTRCNPQHGGPAWVQHRSRRGGQTNGHSRALPSTLLGWGRHPGR